MSKQVKVAASDIRNGTARTLARIASVYPSLNGAERKVADFIQSSPDLAKGLSITRLSEICGTSQTTVVRFCRSIGFDGYTDFKLALVEDIGASSKILPADHDDVKEDDDSDILVQKVFSIDMQAIANTASTLNIVELERAIEALVTAKAVAIIGVGASLSVAMDAYFRLLRSGIHSWLSVDSHMQAVNARLLEPGDVALAVTYSGETREVLDNLGLARDAGATTVCITNFPRSTVARQCDICLAASTTRTRWLHDSISARLAQLAIVDVLCVGIARKKDVDVLQILERIEKATTTKRRRRKS